MLSGKNTKYVPGIENGILDVFILREKIREDGLYHLPTCLHLTDTYLPSPSFCRFLFWRTL